MLVTYFLLTSCSDSPTVGADEATQKINKIYFMSHPVCWQTVGQEPPPGEWDKHSSYSRSVWQASYDRELEVNQLQKALMEQMGPDEVLLLFPVEDKLPMRDLEEFAKRTLGRRAIIVDRPLRSPPAAWRELANPLERFLNDSQLQGREEFLAGVPPQIQAELEAEIRAALAKGGAVAQSWNPSVLEVLYYSRLCAMDIQKEFQRRNLVYDPEKTAGEAFGEGFEQCAMTFKQMLVPYLGLKDSVDNRWDLSVSGASFLVDATFRERIDLDENLRLYLWETEDEKIVAMYARSRCRLEDPLLYAQVPVEGLSLQVREIHGKLCWPDPAAPELSLELVGTHLRVPVYNGIRRDFNWQGVVDTAEEACYLIARDIGFKDFRRLLLSARIDRTADL